MCTLAFHAVDRFDWVPEYVDIVLRAFPLESLRDCIRKCCTSTAAWSQTIRRLLKIA